ncbi:MAG: DUF3631 domain-containing protein [Gemmatimonadetes bacterium]|nr:DUF3631 domain-containing protein [Gemmatimonadota bacterium]
MSGERQDLEWLVEGTLGLGRLDKHSTAEDLRHFLEEFGAAVAPLTDLERELVRRMAVNGLRDIGVTAPAGLVNTALGNGNGKPASGPGRVLTFSDPEPWSEPVDGVGLLERLHDLIVEYLVLPLGAADYLTVFTVVTHTINAFPVAPYAAVLSPTHSCGKTRVLDVLNLVVRRPWLPVILTGPVLFRGIEQWTPTTLIDEAEVVRGKGDAAENIRALLHAGYRRGVTVARCVGESCELRNFDIFGPKVFAAIGKLPGTLTSRCVVINMRRRAQGEHVGYWRSRVVEPHGHDLSRQLRRWAVDHLELLRTSTIEAPDFLGDRQAEVWQPLFAVADLIGGGWRDRLVAAAHALTGGPEPGTAAAELLCDVRDIITGGGFDRIASADLATALNGLEGHPWPDYNRGQGIRSNQVARLLGEFEVRPRTIRCGDQTLKGYPVEVFRDAFERYFLPGGRSGTVTPSQPRQNAGSDGFADRNTNPSVTVRQPGESPAKTGHVTDVTVPDTLRGEKRLSAPSADDVRHAREYVIGHPGCSREQIVASFSFARWRDAETAVDALLGDPQFAYLAR